MNNIGGQKLPKKLTKKQIEAKKEENQLALDFQKAYTELTEKHNLGFKSVLVMDNGMIKAGVRIVNIKEQEADKKKDKKRAKDFVDEYRKFEEEQGLTLTAIIFHDDITGEVRPKMQISKKATKLEDSKHSEEDSN